MHINRQMRVNVLLALLFYYNKRGDRNERKILITSLTRVRKDAPWRVGIYINPNYTFINVRSKGNVATSPRFNMFLAEVEKKVSRYPVDISFYSIADNRDGSH